MVNIFDIIIDLSFTSNFFQFGTGDWNSPVFLVNHHIYVELSVSLGTYDEFSFGLAIVVVQ